MINPSYRTTLLCATILMGGLATPAFAQIAAGSASATSTVSADPAAPADPADSAEPGQNNDIIVTGSRRQTTLQDAPINISAVGAELLAKERIDDVRSLAAFTPGMTVVDTGPASTGTIIMRGVNSSDTSVTGSQRESAVGVYLGEVPLYYDFKLIDISRVEVLQGPQGTLYGLGTLAGAVRYMPNRPDTDRISVDAHGRLFGMSHSGSFGFNGDFAVNVPIVADHIAFRTATGYFDSPGFIDYNYLLQSPGVSDPQPGRATAGSTGSFGTAAQQAANFTRKKDVNYEQTFTTRNQLLLEANPNIKLYLTYAHQQTKTGGRQSNGAGVLGTGEYENPSRYLEPTSRKADLYAGELNINLFNVAQLVSTTAFTNQKITSHRDNTDLLLDLDYGYEAFPNFSSYNDSTQYYRQFNQEVRLVSTHGGPFSWVVGGFYNNLRYYSNYQEHTPGFANFAGINRPDDLEYISFVNTRTKEKAAYGEGTFHLTDKWQVTGGVRYYKYDASATGGTDTPLFGGGLTRTPYPLIQFAPSRIKSGDTSSDGFVYKGNTSYKFNNDLLAYFTYSTGYRTGSVNRVAPCILPLNPAVQNVCALPNELAYKPDKTRNFELGVRASLFEKRLQFTLDAFHIDWTDIQVASQTINGAVGITVNGGKAVSKGVEFTGQFKVTPRLVVNAVYSYTDAHLTETAPGVVVSQGVQYDAPAGGRLPGSTKHAGSAGITYTQPLGEGRELEFNWLATYTGDIYSRIGMAGNGEVILSYTPVRASVTYHTKPVDISVFADNIFDKYAVIAVENDRSSYNQVRTDVVERYYGYGVLSPRRVGIDFRFHY